MIRDKDNLVLVPETESKLEGNDVSSEDQEITSPFDPKEIRIDTKNAQMDALIKRIRNDEIDLSPDFQRQDNIWNVQNQSRLIESMLVKIPLPAFYMDASDDNKWLVVDGLQRLTVIKNFVIDETLELVGLEFLNQYDGKKFSDLPRNFQRRIEETDIVMYLIQPGTPAQVKFDIFSRINTGGIPLSSQEIRHALNQGRVTSLLKKLAQSEEFIIATDKGVASKRMDDRECVLRFFAFTITPPSDYFYDGFDKFLNEAMVNINKMEEKKLSEISCLFLRAMKRAEKIFKKDAFRKRFDDEHTRYPINKALFEAWSVNLSSLSDFQAKLLISKRDILIEKYMELMADKEFENAITQGTGSIKRVKLRFLKIQEIIKEVLSD